MMYCARLLLQLLLAVTTASAVRLHIMTEDSKILTRSGQNITLPCIAKGKNFDAFTNPVIWYKVADNGEEFQINTGAVISTPYAETGRYGVDVSLDLGVISTVGMPLSIKGLTLAENGTYRCELRSRSKVLASIIHQVDIIGPITKLELTSPDHHFNNKTRQGVFVFYEKEPSTVTCELVGSGPPPVMQVIRGDVDITPLFVRTESIKIIGEPGLQYSMYTIEYKSTKLKMEKDHNGLTLYCTAQVPTFTELSLTKTAVIDVLYAAQFSCDTALLATVGEVDLEISCRITANPVVQPNNVWWTFSRRDWNLTNGQSREDFSSHIVLNDDAVIATLTIANVSNSSFQTYYLTAQTRLAKRQHSIILEEDIPTTLPPTTTTLTTTTTTRTTTSSNSPPTETIAAIPKVKESSATHSTSTETNRLTTTVKGVKHEETTPVIVQTTPVTLTPEKASIPLSTTTVSTSTHKRRKHGKHKHHKKKNKKGQQSSSSKLRTTTVSTFTTTAKLHKVQETNNNNQVTSSHKNKTSGNKTVDKHDVPSDVQYTIIDQPVKENNASSGFSLHNITSCLGFLLYLLCTLITL